MGLKFYSKSYYWCTKAELTRLQTLQNKALRINYRDHSVHSINSLQQRAGLLTLQQRHNLNLQALVHSRKIPALCSRKISNCHTWYTSRTLLDLPFSHNSDTGKMLEFFCA